MNIELVAARDAAVAQQDQVVARYAPRYDTDFGAALQPVVVELDRIATLAAAEKSDAVELSRTWRWLGDAHFEYGRFAGRPSWYAGAAAYLEAERALADDAAPVEQAKLDFNFGNTLAQLSEGTDIALLEAADIRYRRAAEVFRNSFLTDFARQVEQRHALLRAQLKMARLHTIGQRDLARLQELVSTASLAGPIEQEKIQKAFEALAKRFDPRAIVDALDQSWTALAALETSSSVRNADLAGLRAKIHELVAALPPERVPSAASGKAMTEYEDLARRLFERIQSDGAADRISSDRARQLTRSLQRFMEATPDAADDILTHETKVSRMREEKVEVADAVLTRRRLASRVLDMIDGLTRAALAEQLRPMLPADESHRAIELFAAVSELSTVADQAQDDEARLRELAPRIWRTALDVQQFARRHHLVVAAPIFAMFAEHAPVASLFVSGASVLREAASRLAARDTIALFTEARRDEVGQERWSQLLAASVAVFDIGIQNGPARMQVCYELGLALALGKPCVIVKRADTVVPFDVEIPPIVFSNDVEANLKTLENAVYQELSGVRWGGRTPGMGNAGSVALSALKLFVQRSVAPGQFDIQLRMAHANVGDAVALYRSLNNIVGGLGAGGPAVLLPAWPSAGPDPRERPRCFHVMPFSQRWSNASRDRLAEACAQRGWNYTRGDESKEQRVVPGIWRDICRASAVVIDLTSNDQTGPNLNVGLELGLVHALGRPYRIVTRGRPERHMFPAVAKMQIHGYREEGAPNSRRTSGLGRFAGPPTSIPGLPDLDSVVAPLLMPR